MSGGGAKGEGFHSITGAERDQLVGSPALDWQQGGVPSTIPASAPASLGFALAQSFHLEGAAWKTALECVSSPYLILSGNQDSLCFWAVWLNYV